MESQFFLLKAERFLPLFLTQFAGAFNDNFAKAFYVVMVAYGLWDTGSTKPEILVSIAAAIFIIPFIFVAPIAGTLADRIDKAKLIRLTKWVEVLIVIVCAVAIYMASVHIAFLSLFLLGVQSAVFGPCKFSLLPQHLRREELVAGNALASSSTYIAILSGSMLGAFVAPLQLGRELVVGVLALVSVIGLIASYKIPPAIPDPTNLRNSSMRLDVKLIKGQPRAVWLAILGTAWFYFIAASFHAQFPVFTKMSLYANANVLAVFMAIFSTGIAVGGLLNHRLLRGEVSLKFVPWAAGVIGVSGFILYKLTSAFPIPLVGKLYNVVEFVTMPKGVLLSLDLFVLAVAAGFYVIPLRALVQEMASEAVRARVVSLSNMCEAIFILASALFAGFLFSYDFKVEELYLTICVMTFIMGCCLFISFSRRVRPKR
ncbi:MAG: MFS transporter [Micavibrio sp.]|nr:MFS transporter [Micavibrio sp.]